MLKLGILGTSQHCGHFLFQNLNKKLVSLEDTGAWDTGKLVCVKDCVKADLFAAIYFKPEPCRSRTYSTVIAYLEGKTVPPTPQLFWGFPQNFFFLGLYTKMILSSQNVI